MASEQSFTSSTTEMGGSARPGVVGVLAALTGVAGVIASIVLIATVSPIFVITLVLSALAIVTFLPGHYLVQPNEALVLVLFGRYQGTITEPGWHWTVNPFTKLESRKLSKRVHNLSQQWNAAVTT